MVNINKTQFPDELRKKAWQKFFVVAHRSTSPDILARELKKVLTSSEIIMLEKRLTIPLLIENGMSYRQIGQMIDVSQTTISFIKQGFKKRPVIHRKYSSSSKKFPRAHRSSKGAGTLLWK